MLPSRALKEVIGQQTSPDSFVSYVSAFNIRRKAIVEMLAIFTIFGDIDILPPNRMRSRQFSPRHLYTWQCRSAFRHGKAVAFTSIYLLAISRLPRAPSPAALELRACTALEYRV